MATPFLVDQSVIAALKELARIAESNPISESEMRGAVAKAQAGEPSLSPINVQQSIELPLGYSVTMTVEWQPIGLCRHVSIAPPEPGRVFSPEAFRMIAHYLGFSDGLPVEAWFEHLVDQRIAVNVLQPLAVTVH